MTTDSEIWLAREIVEYEDMYATKRDAYIDGYEDALRYLLHHYRLELEDGNLYAEIEDLLKS